MQKDVWILDCSAVWSAPSAPLPIPNLVSPGAREMPSIARDEKREGRVILIGLDEKDTLYLLAFPEFCIGCPSNEKKNISVGTETNRNKICFGCVLVCFVKPKTNNQKFWFVLVCFGVSNINRNNWNKQNCFETNRNNPKLSENTKISSLSNCFGWSSVCFGSTETLKFAVWV